jgi:hypothetical protein
MKANLDEFRREATAWLEECGLVAFKGQSQQHREMAAECIFWDTEGAPDYKEFVSAAVAVGAKVVVVSGLKFHSEIVDEALEQLQSAALDRETRRSLERGLKDLRGYDGFVCEVELSFAHGGRTYAFVQTTPWYDEAMELLDQIEDAFDTPDENPLSGGYYSNN